MFDDQPNANQSTPPGNLPSEPVDMFADVDKNVSPAGNQPPNALSAGLLKPKTMPSVTAPVDRPTPMPPSPANTVPTQPQTMPQSPAMYTMKEPILGKIILLVVFGVLFAGLGYGGWWAYNNFIKTAPVPTEQNVPVVPAPIENTNTNLPENNVTTETTPTATTATSSEVTQQMKNDQILFGEAIDTDKDGLDDVRERELGTNPLNSDTDNDGLSDGDEVLIWKTNPLNPDTDGDGYLDGEEVRNGYNPLGPGKLNIIPQTATTTPATNSTQNK